MHTSTAQSHARPHSHHHAGQSAPATARHGSAAKPKLYNPRHPERTLLYQTIAEHFETWHELASAGQFDGRGVCPSCNTRRMVETAAHLTDHVFPRLPVRQWVLSVPKRLRYFMQRDGAVLNMVLRIFLRVIAQSLQAHSPGVAQVDKAAQQIGAVAFIHRFGRAFVGRGLLESFEAKENHPLPWTACAKRALPWCTAVPNSTASPVLTSEVPGWTSCTSRHWS